MLLRVFQDAAAVYTLGPSFPGPPSPDRALLGHEARAALAHHLTGPTRDTEVTTLYHELFRGPLRPTDDAYLHRMREALLDAVERGLLAVTAREIRGGGSVRREELEEEPSSAPPPQRQERKLVDLWVRVAITPDEAAKCGDKFVVSATDGSYKQTKTVKDDKVPGDDAIDLEYTDLFDDRNYSLEVVPARGGSHFVFRDVPYAALDGYGQAGAEAPYEPRADDPRPEEVGA